MELVPSLISLLACIIMLIFYKKVLKEERRKTDRVNATIIELLQKVVEKQDEIINQIRRFHVDTQSHLNSNIKQSDNNELIKLQQEQTELLKIISQQSNGEENKKLQEKWKQLSKIMNSFNE